MNDYGVCDADLPAKWQSSLTLYRYVPEDEYQIYENRRIVYLKLACTITGYQPAESEVEGELLGDFNLKDLTEREWKRLLEEYYPAQGALVEVTVSPQERDDDPSNGPYIMDVQPKQRRLYELASDTQEIASRSLETVNLRKAAGTTESLEVLDVDLGYSKSKSSGWNVGGTYGGVGANVGRTSSSSFTDSKEEGTKNLSTDTRERVEMADSSRERREGYSHTTQLSQLYHLFESYHVGTNRALFFIQPRPHTMETQSVFVRGPRPIDGIQEILLVVNQPVEMDLDDLCVSVRLDTGHLVETQNNDYATDVSTVQHGHSVPVPTKEHPDAVLDGSTEVDIRGELGPWAGLKIYRAKYDRYVLEDSRNRAPWTPAEAGHPEYDITRYTVETDEGDNDIVFDREANAILITSTARSEVLVFDRIVGHYLSFDKVKVRGRRIPKLDSGESSPSGLFAGIEAMKEYTRLEKAGELETRGATRTPASVRINIHLQSKDRTVELEPSRDILISTRGLCCCPGHQLPGRPLLTEKGIAGLKPVDYERDIYQPSAIASERLLNTIKEANAERLPTTLDIETDERVGPNEMLDMEPLLREQRSRGLYTPYEANAISDSIRTVMQRSHTARQLNDERPTPIQESSFFMDRFRARLTESGIEQFIDLTPSEVVPEFTKSVAKLLDMDPEHVSIDDIVTLDTEALALETDLDESAIIRHKFALLGAPVVGGSGISGLDGELGDAEDVQQISEEDESDDENQS